MSDLEATYKVRVGNDGDGDHITMTGDPDKLDRVVELMKRYGPVDNEGIKTGEIPERVEFILTNGITIAVSHGGGDRLLLTVDVPKNYGTIGPVSQG